MVEHAPADEYWMPQPPAPVSPDEAAFEDACKTFFFHHQEHKENARKIWEAALAYRNNKPA